MRLGAFHFAQRYFIHNVYFTNPEGIYFIENKKHCYRSAFYFLNYNAFFDTGYSGVAKSCILNFGLHFNATR